MVERRAAEAAAAVSFSSLASCCKYSMEGKSASTGGGGAVNAFRRGERTEEEVENGMWLLIVVVFSVLRGDRQGAMSGTSSSMV